MPIPSSERAYLRDLAKRQAEYAALPEMAELRRLWTLHNGLRGERPMVTFEMWTCGAELLPPLRCQSPEAQRIERHLQNNLTNYERIRDDRVVPPAYVIPLTTAFTPFDLPFARTTAADSTGAELGYHVEPPIHELGEELDRLGGDHHDAGHGGGRGRARAGRGGPGRHPARGNPRHGHLPGPL